MMKFCFFSSNFLPFRVCLSFCLGWFWEEEDEEEWKGQVEGASGRSKWKGEVMDGTLIRASKGTMEENDMINL